MWGSFDRALQIDYRALLIDDWALLMRHVALFCGYVYRTDDRALLIGLI
jgi:hypothetical protein